MFRATVFTTAKNWKQTSGASSGRTEAQTLICLHHGTGFSNSEECAVYTWTLLQPGEECAVYTCNNLDRPQVNYAAAKEKKIFFQKGICTLIPLTQYFLKDKLVELERVDQGLPEVWGEVINGVAGRSLVVMERSLSSFFSFLNVLFTLCICFSAVLGLRCCTRAFCFAGKQGLLSRRRAQASHLAEHELPGERVQQSWPLSLVAQRRVGSS